MSFTRDTKTENESKFLLDTSKFYYTVLLLQWHSRFRNSMQTKQNVAFMQDFETQCKLNKI